MLNSIYDRPKSTNDRISQNLILKDLSETRFELSELYTSLSDPKILDDLKLYEELSIGFKKSFKGKLDTELGKALSELNKIEGLEDKILLYLQLNNDCNQKNPDLQKILSLVTERIKSVSAENGMFFKIEISELSNLQYESLLVKDEVVATHKYLLDNIREHSKYRLSEEVESALLLRAPYGPKLLVDVYRENLAGVRCQIQDRLLSIKETTDIMQNGKDQNTREQALIALNNSLADKIAPIYAATLNGIIGKRNTENKERGYPHIMSMTNIQNGLKDSVVESMLSAVLDQSTEITQRFYNLLAKDLGYTKLKWSDRNPPLHAINKVYSWEEAITLIIDVFYKLNPILADIVIDLVNKNRIDAPHYMNKRIGGNCKSSVIPELGSVAYISLNFSGTLSDVYTLIHEFGHAINFHISGKKHGKLLQAPPLAIAETPSMFSEMLLFEALLEACSSEHDKYVVLMNRCSQFLNAVVRQTSFTVFEQQAHETRKNGKLSVDDYNKLWLEATKKLYGDDNIIFDYGNMQYLWSYIPHFTNPFYVSNYVFGELFTQGLYDKKISDPNFPERYLGFLEAGGSKSPIALAVDIGKDLEDKEYWLKAIRSSIVNWLNQAEIISSKLNKT
jgi:oligoendopeptidase F